MVDRQVKNPEVIEILSDSDNSVNSDPSDSDFVPDSDSSTSGESSSVSSSESYNSLVEEISALEEQINSKFKNKLNNPFQRYLQLRIEQELLKRGLEISKEET